MLIILVFNLQLTKTIMTIALALFLITYIHYYNHTFTLHRSRSKSHPRFNKYQKYGNKTRSLKYYYNGTEDFLINTPGCYIPNYSKYLHITEAKYTNDACGTRAVFINKISDSVIKFQIDKLTMQMYTSGNEKIQCCYRSVRPAPVSEEKAHLIFSPCVLFRSGSTAYLEYEIVTVTCDTYPSKGEPLYEDAYVFVKKIKRTINVKQEKVWNVIVLGMDTMSRGRALNSMPHVANYFLKNKWLDYKGYNKIEFNTLPNLIAILTGKSLKSVYKLCGKRIDKCNKHFLWSKFKDAGFVTAYGEEFLDLPDTFAAYNGFKNAPTDHYIRPFFLLGEKRKGNVICTKKRTSGKHLLDYAFDFINTYKRQEFFGLFWMNTYSHNIYNIPSLIDDDIAMFFNKINNTGALMNTFIIFLSDHGTRFGDMRVPVESYYEERLPMLFVWVPKRYRKLYAEKYQNFQLNQNRLITPFDIHTTLWEILKMSNLSVRIIPSEECPECKSMSIEQSVYRNCNDAHINVKWCSCLNLTTVHRNDKGAEDSLLLVVDYIKNIVSNIKTDNCTACSPLHLKKVLRQHSYTFGDQTTYYVVAFVLTPGEVAFEATVRKNGKNYKIMQPTKTITQYSGRRYCVLDGDDHVYCMCKDVKCH